MNRETGHLILTEELGMRKICAKMVSGNLTEQPRDALSSAVFDIQMLYGDAAASLLTCSRTLRILFISKVKTALKEHHFGSKEAGLKRHPTKCVPAMLQTMAAPLEKACAGTRDVL
jgi:hypothetical protein